MSIKFTNNATATLAASISTSSTSLTVTTSQGALFPTLGAGDYFYATLVDSSNNIEIVKITARSGDTLTAVRAQESTTARIYAAADKLELRVTAAALTNFATQDGPNTFSAANTFSGTNIYSGSNSFTGPAVTFTNIPIFSGGSLPIANGGTGQITAQAAMNALAGAQTNNRVLRSDGTNTTLSQVVLTTDVSGTLPVANGGTGAATFTSGALLQGNGTSAVTAATAANIVSAIGATAVALSTNSTNALGYNQTWQAVTRAANTTYTNSTGKPIAWYWAVTSGGNTGQCSVQFTIAGSVTWTASFYCTSGYTIGGEIIIPSGTTYSFQIGGFAGGSAGQSYELR